MSSVTNIVIGLLVVGLLLTRQLQPRLAKESSSVRLVLILAVFGVVETRNAIGTHTVPVNALAWLGLSLVAGAGMGRSGQQPSGSGGRRTVRPGDREPSSRLHCGWFPWPHTSRWTPLSSTPPRSPWGPPASSCTWR